LDIDYFAGEFAIVVFIEEDERLQNLLFLIAFKLVKTHYKKKLINFKEYIQIIH